jgi:hypothetical protein
VSLKCKRLASERGVEDGGRRWHDHDPINPHLRARATVDASEGASLVPARGGEIGPAGANTHAQRRRRQQRQQRRRRPLRSPEVAAAAGTHGQSSDQGRPVVIRTPADRRPRWRWRWRLWRWRGVVPRGRRQWGWRSSAVAVATVAAPVKARQRSPAASDAPYPYATTGTGRACATAHAAAQSAGPPWSRSPRSRPCRHTADAPLATTGHRWPPLATAGHRWPRKQI